MDLQPLEEWRQPIKYVSSFGVTLLQESRVYRNMDVVACGVVGVVFEE